MTEEVKGLVHNRTSPSASTGAASDPNVDWHAINWQKAHEVVRRLQARIVKATQEGRWGKVKALQHLLTHSFSGKALAVKRVTENHGKRTPGVDGETWNTPEKKATAIQALQRRGYHPLPLRRLYIPKSNGKRRPLGIPTMKDRAMQALHLLALDPIAETTGDQNSYGFRLERSTADAIQQCFVVLSRKNSAPWILEGDIKACFDRISHEWLLAHIPLDKAILRKWLKAGFIEKHALYPTEEGTPQGGIISPSLANLTLDGLERLLRERYPRAGKGKSRGERARVNFVRFADDFIITGTSKALLEEEVKPLVEQFMSERGLELSSEKTRITHIEDGFDFLGQHLRKYDGKLLIRPSQKNVKALVAKVRKIIRESPTSTAGQLIMALNPVIRGWANYHQHVASKATFCKVDHAIFMAIKRWAQRRHPKKPARWVKQKYFRRNPGQALVFFGERVGERQEKRSIQLYRTTQTPICRHLKVQAEANPYDPTWETYYAERLGLKMARHLKGRRELLYLWTRQKGICPLCCQKIAQMTGWDTHHVIWRKEGGGDEVENRVLLHPNCHRQVHNRWLEVAKLRPVQGV